ncbi:MULTISPECIES: hypothetical protein [unclassified Streptomyces]|uniref:hypothetical protein n=1 Tax=unclassified Streptomyces TaxID=2593676 RepID=UPI0022547BA9|nr:MULTISPECIES: hypothetical protein [unclassified Streptomyces]MCX4529044.1 hypothetical protein [Streptomyces sp. NBC_01551]MCX4540273.1 hypothetical protein [Streptomyces sp. NBC_01565]
MHPTRTTTTLLLGVACAVSAVSGCVNVTPAPMQPAAAPASGVPPQHEARGGPGASPVVVQAPALEALKAGDTVAGRPGQAAASQAAPAPAASAAADAATGAEAAVPPVPDIPEPRQPAEAATGLSGGPDGHDRADGRGDGKGDGEGRGGRRHRGKKAGPEVPRELVKELPVHPAEVCALGRRHGRWHPDSPEARICAGVREG